MEGFSFVTPITGLNRPNTGKEDDDDFIDNKYIKFEDTANRINLIRF
jgi:hypothetical protein